MASLQQPAETRKRPGAEEQDATANGRRVPARFCQSRLSPTGVARGSGKIRRALRSGPGKKGRFRGIDPAAAAGDPGLAKLHGLVERPREIANERAGAGAERS